MTQVTTFRLCAIVALTGFWIGCGGHPASLRSPSRIRLPTTYIVPQDENLTSIATRFYGSDSMVTTHALWYANPDIRNLGWIKAGQKLTIPVLPDQSVPFTAGETIHVFFTSMADPPYGFDLAISEDGHARFFLGVQVQVAGLTPEQVGAAIKHEYVPRYYRRLDLAVIRVQPDGAPNASQR